MRHGVLLVLLTAGLLGQAQDMVGIVKTNPIGWFAGQYQIGYEHFLSERASVQLVPGGIYGSIYLTPNDTLSTLPSVSATRSGLIVVPEIRYYVAGEAPDGIYLAPFGRYRSVTTTLKNDASSRQTRTAMGGGFVVGYQYSLANGWTGEVFLGPQFKSTTTVTEGRYDEYGFALTDDNAAGLRFGLTLGLGFEPVPYADLLD